MDGMELLSELHQSGQSSASVIVVSSRPREEVWDRVSQNGAVAWVGKPASEESLVTAIKQINELKHNQSDTGETHE